MALNAKDLTDKQIQQASFAADCRCESISEFLERHTEGGQVLIVNKIEKSPIHGVRLAYWPRFKGHEWWQGNPGFPEWWREQ